CVLSAIEAAVAHLIAQGVDRRLWQTAEGHGSEHPELSKYLSRLN
ncbi:MAG: curli production assembly/transport protein CsgG, partial [Gammaproteobacteria bacterium HGW-Gammaproteobacteria-9]